MAQLVKNNADIEKIASPEALKSLIVSMDTNEKELNPISEEKFKSLGESIIYRFYTAMDNAMEKGSFNVDNYVQHWDSGKIDELDNLFSSKNFIDTVREAFEIEHANIFDEVGNLEDIIKNNAAFDVYQQLVNHKLKGEDYPNPEELINDGKPVLEKFYSNEKLAPIMKERSKAYYTAFREGLDTGKKNVNDPEQNEFKDPLTGKVYKLKKMSAFKKALKEKGEDIASSISSKIESMPVTFLSLQLKFLNMATKGVISSLKKYAEYNKFTKYLNKMKVFDVEKAVNKSAQATKSDKGTTPESNGNADNQGSEKKEAANYYMSSNLILEAKEVAKFNSTTKETLDLIFPYLLKYIFQYFSWFNGKQKDKLVFALDKDSKKFAMNINYKQWHKEFIKALSLWAKFSRTSLVANKQAMKDTKLMDIKQLQLFKSLDFNEVKHTIDFISSLKIEDKNLEAFCANITDLSKGFYKLKFKEIFNARMNVEQFNRLIKQFIPVMQRAKNDNMDKPMSYSIGADNIANVPKSVRVGAINTENKENTEENTQNKKVYDYNSKIIDKLTTINNANDYSSLSKFAGPTLNKFLQDYVKGKPGYEKALKSIGDTNQVLPSLFATQQFLNKDFSKNERLELSSFYKLITEEENKDNEKNGDKTDLKTDAAKFKEMFNTIASPKALKTNEQNKWIEAYKKFAEQINKYWDNFYPTIESVKDKLDDISKKALSNKNLMLDPYWRYIVIQQCADKDIFKENWLLNYYYNGIV